MKLSYPVLINNIYYDSCCKAANYFNVDERTIINRCKSDNFDNYKFTEYRIPLEKRCSKCNETKQIEEFKKVKNNRSGYSTWCKKCYSKYNIQNVNNLKRKEKDDRYRFSEKGRISIKYNKEKRRVLEDKANTQLSTEEKNYIKWLHWKVREMRKAGFDVHLDHIIPISKGGLHIPENLQIIHAEDNRKKSNKIL